MSEFTEKNVALGLIRGAVTFAAILICSVGLVIAIFAAIAGTIMTLLGIGALVWNIISSYKDTSRLKWLNISIKAFFATLFTVALVFVLI